MPALLHDIHLLDLLELSGTSLEASRLMQLSQPTVSRRVRQLADDFGLEINPRRLVGCCYGTNAVMRLLRLSCRLHRLSNGAARLGADAILQPLLACCTWLLPTPPRFRLVESWVDLVRQGVLDGALVSGLEFQGDDPPHSTELEWMHVGSFPLTLATGPGVAKSAEISDPPVLVPNRTVAHGLRQNLSKCGLSLKTANNNSQSLVQWLKHLASSSLAMPLLDLEPAEWWQPLQRKPLPQPVHLPVWLVFPSGWQQQTVLVNTARQLQSHPALLNHEKV